MALVICPECKREISNKVRACPHCGYPFDYNNKAQQVEITAVSLKSKNPKKTRNLLISIVLFVGIICLCVAGLLFYRNEKIKYEKNEYIDKLNLITIYMYSGAIEAEDLCILTYNVWRNAIYEESDSVTNKYTIISSRYSSDRAWYSEDDFVDDFNTALSKLFIDSDTINKTTEIEANQTLVMNGMKELQNPPEDLEKCYDTISDLYLAYQGLTELAINPKGSLQTFGENKTNEANLFVELYKKLETQIPEVEDYRLKFIFDRD